MTYAPNDPDVNQMMAVFDKLSRQADTAKDEMAMAVNSFVGRAQDIIAAKIAENTELRAQLAERDALIAEVTKTIGGYPDSDLLSLARTVAIGYQQWSDGHDAMTDNLRAQLAERDAEIAQLRAQVAERDTVISRWYATADAIMLCATGEIATLSDSDVCGVISELRAQVATLTERLSRCACTDDFGDVAE